MASEKIDASEYSPDTLEFIQCLNAHQKSQFIGKDALVKNKRASGRHKDLGDAEYLSAS